VSLTAQPFVYVTVYVVVLPGVIVIDCVVAPPGAHKYVPPAKEGVAVNVVELPEQTTVASTTTLGEGFTVTVVVNEK
jgi:hypothetical protein